MEPFTSLLITRNLERAPLIILTFVQRLLVRDHYLLQVPRAQVEDVTEQHPACVLLAIVVSVFTKVTVHQVRILVVGVVNGISALLRRQLPRIDVALAVNGVDLVAIRWRCLWIALFTLRLGPASDDEQVRGRLTRVLAAHRVPSVLEDDLLRLAVSTSATNELRHRSPRYGPGLPGFRVKKFR